MCHKNGQQSTAIFLNSGTHLVVIIANSIISVNLYRQRLHISLRGLALSNRWVFSHARNLVDSRVNSMNSSGARWIWLKYTSTRVGVSYQNNAILSVELAYSHKISMRLLKGLLSLTPVSVGLELSVALGLGVSSTYSEYTSRLVSYLQIRPSTSKLS